MIIVDELPFSNCRGRRVQVIFFQSMHKVSSPISVYYEEWKLQKRIINFSPIFAHRGENIGQALEKCIRDWGIERIFTTTVDNAFANTVGVEYLRKKLNRRNVCVANGKYMLTRCVAHVINLIVQEGVKHDSVFVDRVRTIVRYIRASPSRIKKFYKCAEEEMIDTKAYLCLDMPTRWNSTYMKLKVVAKYKRAFDSYSRDDYNFFLDLSTGDGVPTFDDWENVRKIEKVLEPFYDLTLKWANSEDLDVISVTSKMREKYNKYWGDAKKINFLVYLANIFDPRRKMDFVNFGVNLRFPNIATDVMKMIDKELHCLFDEHSSISRRAMVYEGQSNIPTKDWLRKSNDPINLDEYVAELQNMEDDNISF
ncbi:DAYSLEEPER [Hibiscus trionum]|uniref:DAYSLEEPER n=1 Tax=Hibiscus trionum TaxID=183268 RepID=A0A9W7IKV3_HIBTR|nr:DAYSLEEPER [Hibiscus trionum]